MWVPVKDRTSAFHRLGSLPSQSRLPRLTDQGTPSQVDESFRRTDWGPNQLCPDPWTPRTLSQPPTPSTSTPTTDGETKSWVTFHRSFCTVSGPRKWCLYLAEGQDLQSLGSSSTVVPTKGGPRRSLSQRVHVEDPTDRREGSMYMTCVGHSVVVTRVPESGSRPQVFPAQRVFQRVAKPQVRPKVVLRSWTLRLEVLTHDTVLHKQFGLCRKILQCLETRVTETTRVPLRPWV